MTTMLNRKKIKLMCGKKFYERGEEYYNAGMVGITLSDASAGNFQAVVKGGGKNKYDVSIQLKAGGDIEAQCTCPAYNNYNYYCKHIAAALLQINEMQQEGRIEVNAYPSLLHPETVVPEGRLTPRYHREASEEQIIEDVLALFSSTAKVSPAAKYIMETREPLSIEYLIKLVPYGLNKHMIGLEMKLGARRLYIVQQMKQFLSRMQHGGSYVFSKNFTYNPEAHYFKPHDEAVLKELIQLERQEEMYHESLNSYPGRGKNQDRLLLIPPLAWEQIAPLLQNVPEAYTQQEEQIFSGVSLTDSLLPLDFEFNKTDTGAGYELTAMGIRDVLILPEYRMAVKNGIFYKMSEESVSQIAGLQEKLSRVHFPKLTIPAKQMGPYIEKVVPGLMRLGRVHLAEEVSSHMVQVPLKARLYLDRVRDKLLASLEFQYGDVVINPVEEKVRLPENKIIIRDKSQEEQIIRLMQTSDFTQTESGYYLENEDAEFDFLYYTMPQLEQLLDVYATSAVKVRILSEPVSPKLHVDMDERTDWMEFKFDINGIPLNEIKHVIESVEAKRRYHRLSNGALMPLSASAFQEIVRLMNDMGFRKGEIDDGIMKLPVAAGLKIMDRDLGEQVQLGSRLKEFIGNLAHPEHMDFPIPDRLAPILRDYQKQGYQWMKTLASYRFGGILADDMGLGKTLQSITYIVSELQTIREHKQPVMIAAPASLIYNWKNELEKFAPELTTIIVDGTKPERLKIIREHTAVDVLITSYPLLRMDADMYSERHFHAFIMDEAQAFKNHVTQTAHAVKSVSARHRFALTGTPIENRLEELWSIYDVVFPELFQGRKAFNELPREVVARRIRPFLLRRVKADVLAELPEKIESLHTSELLTEQKKLYVAFLAKLRAETVKHLSEKQFDKNRIKILAGLTRLRQLCCHPGLFVEGYTGSSAKFEQLLELIEESRSAGKRVLLFSQFTEMLGIIGRELGAQGVPFFYLDGQTPGQERVEMCQRYNEGEKDFFLISLKAGGTGLNLTGADTVILYDLWWNPAVEDQAASRAHRMGQKNVVQVIRLVSRGTVEDKMYELQQRKKNLIEEIIQPGQESSSALSEEEIREILAI
ncbi:DEAD/DEAH box helicase [Paenibacillus sp. 453mf]|uniref:DEAD/DEAH box helicase n=1 Tax=Paenibacillus sp. 453mf TaxID=1761874 RepID=UPI0008EC0CEF|nr:DEAD/DEAH box helicase [Paenibacillus sp. 453mf]SFS35734.1 Superfamily II DNA or RNA helicase, SNF2 family [Paenibacillus sp. 453mf]